MTRSRVWIPLVVFAVLAIAACSAHDGSGAPGSNPGGDAPLEPAQAGAMPAGLRPAYIAAVQRHASPAYAAAPGRQDGWTARNDAHRIVTKFDAQRIAIAPHAGGAWRLDLSLARYGCDERRGPMSPVAPEGSGNRITYRRVDPASGAAVDEWYVNGPLGLEQGFSIATPPCEKDGTIAIDMVLDGLSASPSKKGADLRDSEGRTALRYTDVYAWDAEGRELPAQLSAAGGHLSIRVEAAGAAYPVEVDPLLWGEQAELLPNEADTSDAVGSSVAISGNTAVVGAPFTAPFGSGAAYVFVKKNVFQWTEQQVLVASDGSDGDQFGWSVAIDGDTLVVGAPHKALDGASFVGAAYVFIRLGSGAWFGVQKLLADVPAAQDLFGWSVAVSRDTVLVGAPANGGVGHGSAHVFIRSSFFAWTEQQHLLASDGFANAEFGSSVGISGDTAVVGAPEPGVFAGQAYVFERANGVWTEQAKLLNVTDDIHGFGGSVAIDGDTVVVGAPSTGAIQRGAAFVFVRSGTAWPLQQVLLASDGAFGDAFGNSVAVSGDNVVVGAPGKDVGNQINRGAAYVFVRSGGVWTEQQELLAAAGLAGDLFGSSVALSGDTSVIGAPRAGDIVQGEAYVFAPAPCIIIQRGLFGTVADALINSGVGTDGSADRNYGSACSLTASLDASGGARQGLLRFDLSLIPPTSIILSATVRLHVLLLGGAPVRAHRITAPWAESTVTWNNFNGAFSSTVEATFPAGNPTAADVTSLVQEWVLGLHENDGILLERDLGSTVFASSDCPESLETLRPQLEVCFVPLP